MKNPLLIGHEPPSSSSSSSSATSGSSNKDDKFVRVEIGDVGHGEVRARREGLNGDGEGVPDALTLRAEVWQF